MLLLLVLFALAAAGWFGLSQAIETGLLGRLELLAREKLGLAGQIGSCVPVVMRRGVFLEIPGEDFPIGTPVVMKSPVRAICRFADPDVSFNLSPAAEQTSSLVVFRLPARPAVIELLEGNFTISSLTLGIEWWLPTISLTLRSKEEATILIGRLPNSLNLLVLTGSVSAEIKPRPGKQSPLPLQILTTSRSSFEAGAEFQLANGEGGEWLPSGLKKLELTAITPVAPLPKPGI